MARPGSPCLLREAYPGRGKAYHETAAYQKAMRKLPLAESFSVSGTVPLRLTHGLYQHPAAPVIRLCMEIPLPALLRAQIRRPPPGAARRGQSAARPAQSPGRW